MADALVVKLEQRFIVHQNVAAARFMLQLLHFRAQLQVFTEEGVARLPVALHQRVADKQLAAQGRIDLTVVDLTRGDHRQAVNGDFSVAITAPCARSQCGSLYERLSRCCATGSTHSGSIRAAMRPHRRLVSTSSATMVHFGGFLNRPEPGKMEKRALRAPVYSCFSASFIPMWDSRPVSSAIWISRYSAGSLFTGMPSSFTTAKLGIDILPLAHAQVVEEIHPALAAELVRRERLLLLAEVVPQVHEGEEIGLFVVEATVLFVRGLLFVHRTLARS